MTEHDVLFFREWFNDYVERFQSDDPYTNENNAIKIGHSRRVCGHCVDICRSLEPRLPEEKIYMAETIGLLHDIGRFEQFQKYRTFSDGKSENHAQLGAAVIRRETVLSRLEETEQSIILKGIQFHNLKDIPSNENDDTRFLLKIVRDADKMDILNVLAEFYATGDSTQNPALALDLPDSPGVSDAVVRDLMARRCVDLKHVRFVNDFKLLQISWVFDLNFDYSLNHINARGYMDRIITTLPQIPEIQRIHHHITNYINTPCPS